MILNQDSILTKTGSILPVSRWVAEAPYGSDSHALTCGRQLPLSVLLRLTEPWNWPAMQPTCRCTSSSGTRTSSTRPLPNGRSDWRPPHRDLTMWSIPVWDTTAGSGHTRMGSSLTGSLSSSAISSLKRSLLQRSGSSTTRLTGSLLTT